jgi:hypothetical protein
VQNFYSGFKKLGLTVDMITPHQNKDLSSYSLICIALVDLASDAFVDRINTYVENGGHVILSPRNFTRLENGHFPEGRYGYRFEQLTGATIEGYDVMPKGHHGSIQLTASSRSDYKVSWNTRSIYLWGSWTSFSITMIHLLRFLIIFCEGKRLFLAKKLLPAGVVLLRGYARMVQG